MEGEVETNDKFYCRYVIGHEDDVFGREFLEFEIQNDGKLRYANESQYKRSAKIRKEVRYGLFSSLLTRFYQASKQDFTFFGPNSFSL